MDLTKQTVREKPRRLSHRAMASSSRLSTLVLPIAVIAVLLLLPAVSAIKMSVLGSGGWAFAGYRELFGDPLFWKSLCLSGLYTVVTVVLQVSIGTFAAIVVHGIQLSTRQLSIVTIAIFLPYAVPSVVAVHVWFFLIHDRGFVAVWGERLFGIPPTAWLGSGIFWTLIVVSVWQFFPFAYVTMLAVLRRIPPGIYRSAQVDGAHGWQQFRFVTLHHIGKPLVIVILLRLAFMFTKFDTPWLLGAGTATDKLATLPIYTYDRLPILDSDPAGSIGLASAVVLGFIVMGGIFSIFMLQCLLSRRSMSLSSFLLFPSGWLRQSRPTSTRGHVTDELEIVLTRRFLVKLALWTGLLLVMAFSTVPYAFLVAGSFIPNSKVDRGIDTLVRWDWTFDNYRDLVGDTPLYVGYLTNTVWVSGLTTVGVLVVSIAAAFGFTRYVFRGRRLFQLAALCGYALPPVVLVFPWMRILDAIGLYNHLFGLALANIAFCLPFGIWLMIQYFDAVPRQLDQSAAADGAPWWQTLVVVCRHARAGIVAVAMFAFILSWNDVALSLKLVTDATRKTLAVGVQESILAVEASRYGTFAAASLILVSLAAIGFGGLQVWIDWKLRKEAEE